MITNEIPADQVLFAHNGIDRIEGMLNKSASILTTLLCRQMLADGRWNDRSFLEIGVFKGKFLALVEKMTRGTDAVMIGVDPFEIKGQGIDTVTGLLSDAQVDMGRVQLHVGFSTDHTLVRKAIKGRKLSLIHVDGSHQSEIVEQDLILASELIEDDGFIIADDFFNKNALGIMSAVSKIILEEKADIEPWALFNTKLVFCKAGRGSDSKQSYIAALRANSNIAMFQQFIETFDNGVKWKTRQEFLGHEILIL